MACAVHPTKKCLAMIMQENVLTLLFFTDQSAEEVKLTFSKAKQIHAFSFATGSEDFNFFIVTNLSIDLYKVDVVNQKAKIIKNIPLDLPDKMTEPHIVVDPISCTMVAVDPKTAICYPYFFHMHRQGNSAVKGQHFRLDVSSADPALNESMIRASARASARASIAERALNLFNNPKSGSVVIDGVTTVLHIQPQTLNRNLKYV